MKETTNPTYTIKNLFLKGYYLRSFTEHLVQSEVIRQNGIPTTSILRYLSTLIFKLANI